MFELTYILTFDDHDGQSLSAPKSEIFATREEAEEKADYIEEQCFGHDAYYADFFKINGEKYLPAYERQMQEHYEEMKRLHPEIDVDLPF